MRPCFLVRAERSWMPANSCFCPGQSNPSKLPLTGACAEGLSAGTAPRRACRRKAEVWLVDPECPDASTIRRVGGLLSQGGVVIYPTETYYGLGGHPGLSEALERIYRIKGRAFNKPLPLIAADREAVYGAVAEWPPVAERLAEAFWPGPLTLILRAASSVLALLHAQTGKVAVRISSHPVAQALANEIGGLLTATSANESGQQAYRTPAAMPGELLAQADGLIDAGHSGPDRGNLPSTIVDVSTAVPLLVRPGCIVWERLEEVMSDE
jgi:L-threonylcarbamoyladenylate synthase